MGAKQIFRTGLTDVIFYTAATQTVAWDLPGTIRYENNAVYKYVIFSGTNTIAAGDVVCYVAYASDGTLTVVDHANTEFGAGVAMAAVAAGSAVSGAVGYASGWIQIKGIATLGNALGGSPVLGQPLTTHSATAGEVTLVAAYTDPTVAFCYDATAKVIDCNFPF